MTTYHPATACPCRKRHAAGPKPTAPEGPAFAGKLTKRLRAALEELHAAPATDDENALALLRRRCDDATPPELTEYRRAFEAYLAAFTEWSPELCGNCGVSLLCSTAAPGCPRCVSAEVVALQEEIARLRAEGRQA